MNPALPPPSGKHAIARALLEWTDPARTDPYAPDPDTPRTLAVWVWYPTEPTESPPAPYLPDAWEPAAGMLGLHTAGLSAHSADGGPLAGDRETYPVVLLSPSGFPPLMLSGVAEELASHGFVVAGINHTYEPAVTVFPDGRAVGMNPAATAGALGPQTGSEQEAFARRAEVCRYKAADLSFVADRLGELFPGRLDLSRLTAVGHSFGGVAALQWCHDDPRCSAAVNLDGAIWTEVGRTGVPRPVLQVLAPHPELTGAERDLAYDGWHTVDRAGPAKSLVIAGATHLSFMDVPFLPAGDASPIRAMLAATSIDASRMRAITGGLLVAFLGTGDVSAALVPGVTEPL
ncbi:MAG: hypothetical protein ABW022_19280 [Actinoplanes sp.]